MKRFLKYLPYILFFLFTFIFFSFFTSHIFYYQGKSSLFVFSFDYLNENLQQPGGFLVYLSKFLTAFSYYTVAGAFISSAVLLLFIILSAGIMSTISGKNAGPFPWLIALVLFFLQCNYQYLFVNNLGLLLQVALFFILIKKPGTWMPVIIFPFWFFLTGGFSLVFAAMYILWQVLERPGKFLFRTGAFILAGLITYYISSEFLFFQDNRDLISYPWAPGNVGYQTNIFACIVAVISILPLTGRIQKKSPFKIKAEKFRRFFTPVGISILVLLMTIIALMKYDKKTLQYFKSEKLFVRNRFEDLISFNLEHPSTNKLTIYLVNIALCETGRLNDMLFHFPQSPDGSTLFLKWEIVSEIVRKGGYFYYSTGMINEAHRWAFEYMVMKGLTPEGLKMMIKTELINGNHEAASRYNNILRKTIFYRKDAIRFDRLLYNEAAINADPELGQKRKIKVRRDFFSITGDPFINIQRVVATDSLNRQAFEYMMAWMLINKNYKDIADSWKYLSRYNFKSIPVHIEEAGIALKILYGIDLPVTGNLSINAATVNGFSKYMQTFQAYGSNPQTAEPALKKQFGNTFWYYVFYK